VVARIRRFHVLDGIEHDVSRASTEADLRAIMAEHAPVVATLDRAIETARTGHEPALAGPGAVSRPTLIDAPIFPTGFDPRAHARLQVFNAAVRKRAQQVPALANTRLAAQTQRRGGCRLEPIAPLGDDPLSVLYCHLATGSPYSYRIEVENSQGEPTGRWAEIDALRGNTWYECKCGYEALLAGRARGPGVANAVLDKLDHQVLNHSHIAQECGLEYRYIVSNETVANILRSRWFGVVVNVVPFEGCD
jgi:hypothetical protein